MDPHPPFPNAIVTNLDRPSLQPWREITIFGILVMEVSWLIPWYRSLTFATFESSTARVYLVLGGMALVSLLVVRLLNFLRLKLSIRRVIVGGLLALSAGIGLRTLLYYQEPISLADLLTRPIHAFSDFTTLIPDEAVIILAVCFVWWRGMVIGQSHIGPRLVMRNFQIGILLFMLFVMFNTLVTGETPGTALYIFMFSGLMAMGASRVAVLSHLRGGRHNPFDRRWFGGLLLAVLGVLGVAALAAALVTGSAGVVVRLAVGLFVGLVVLVTFPILYIFAVVLFWVLERIQLGDIGLAESVRGLVANFQAIIQQLAEFLGQYFAFLEVLNRLWRAWGPGLKTLVCLGILAIVGGVILLSLQVNARRRARAMDEEVGSLLESGDLLRLLREALRGRLRDLVDLLSVRDRLGQRKRLLAAARIRQIYAQLMDLSTSLGQPRPTALTPLEFQPTLEALFPGLFPELQTITQAYLRVRYGELPERAEEVESVESAWHRVADQGRQQVATRKRAQPDSP